MKWWSLARIVFVFNEKVPISGYTVSMDASYVNHSHYWLFSDKPVLFEPFIKF